MHPTSIAHTSALSQFLWLMSGVAQTSFFFAIVLFGLGLLEPEGEHVFCFMVRWFFPMHIPHVEKEGEQPCAAFTVVFLTRPIYMELSGLTCSL